MNKTFLKAQWRKLLMVNYAIEPDKLAPYLPFGTELDLYNDTCYISVVGFMFLDTSVMGIKIPFHINFEEVNLRFYVRFDDGNESKRGVVFIKEIVPRPALTFVANAVYNENYETMPMTHSWLMQENELIAEYKWKKHNKWNSMKIHCNKHLIDIADESEEAFITEHYWGYTRMNDRKTAEYGVEHPKWQVYKTATYQIDVDFGDVYGQDFDFLNQAKPISVFLAEGSEIQVKKGKTI